MNLRGTAADSTPHPFGYYGLNFGRFKSTMKHLMMEHLYKICDAYERNWNLLPTDLPSVVKALDMGDFFASRLFSNWARNNGKHMVTEFIRLRSLHHAQGASSRSLEGALPGISVSPPTRAALDDQNENQQAGGAKELGHRTRCPGKKRKYASFSSNHDVPKDGEYGDPPAQSIAYIRNSSGNDNGDDRECQREMANLVHIFQTTTQNPFKRAVAESNTPPQPCARRATSPSASAFITATTGVPHPSVSGWDATAHAIAANIGRSVRPGEFIQPWAEQRFDRNDLFMTNNRTFREALGAGDCTIAIITLYQGAAPRYVTWCVVTDVPSFVSLVQSGACVLNHLIQDTKKLTHMELQYTFEHTHEHTLYLLVRAIEMYVEELGTREGDSQGGANLNIPHTAHFMCNYLMHGEVLHSNTLTAYSMWQTIMMEYQPLVARSQKYTKSVEIAELRVKELQNIAALQASNSTLVSAADMEELELMQTAIRDRQKELSIELKQLRHGWEIINEYVRSFRKLSLQVWSSSEQDSYNNHIKRMHTVAECSRYYQTFFESINAGVATKHDTQTIVSL